MKTVFIIVLSLALPALAQSTPKDTALFLTSEISDELLNNSHDASTLQKANIKLKEALTLLQNTPATSYKDCYDFVAQVYKDSGFSLNTAFSKAQSYCTGFTGSLTLLKHITGQYLNQGFSAQTSVDKGVFYSKAVTSVEFETCLIETAGAYLQQGSSLNTSYDKAYQFCKSN